MGGSKTRPAEDRRSDSPGRQVERQRVGSPPGRSGGIDPLTRRDLDQSLPVGIELRPPGSPDCALLEAQLGVALNPQNEDSLQSLLKVAVDPGGTYITVIGLGLRPWNIFSEEVAFPMAKRAARVDAQNWLALIRKALGKGYIESGIPLRAQVYGARVLLEQVLPDGSVMLKMLAPL